MPDMCAAGSPLRPWETHDQMDEGPLYKMDMYSVTWPRRHGGPRAAANRLKSELGAAFCEGWQMCCDDSSRRNRRQPWVACGAWARRGGRDFCAEFLANVQRHSGGISSAAAAGAIHVNWNDATRFFQRARQQPAGWTASEWAGRSRDPREGK